MVEGLSHITFLVADVAKTAQMLRVVFDAQEVYDSTGRNYSLAYEKFLVVGGVWLALMQGEPLARRTYNHVAFQVPEAELAEYAARIERLGLEVRPGRGRVAGEGRSIYFYDYDNHFFELHTGTLASRLAHYARS